MITYIAKDGDMIDWICWRHYGVETAVPLVLAANPALAGAGPRLAAGTAVLLPDLPPPPPTAGVRLWD